jgi:hypothetical protein
MLCATSMLYPCYGCYAYMLCATSMLQKSRVAQHCHMPHATKSRVTFVSLSRPPPSFPPSRLLLLFFALHVSSVHFGAVLTRSTSRALAPERSNNPSVPARVKNHPPSRPPASSPPALLPAHCNALVPFFTPSSFLALSLTLYACLPLPLLCPALSALHILVPKVLISPTATLSTHTNAHSNTHIQPITEIITRTIAYTHTHTHTHTHIPSHVHTHTHTHT